MDKTYFLITKYLDGEKEWRIWIRKVPNNLNRDNGLRNYSRKPGSPSARRCARLLAKIAESEA